MASVEGPKPIRRRPPSINTMKITTKMNRSDAEEVVEEPLSPTSRLFHEPRFKCYIIAVLGIGKEIDVGVVKDGLEATLVRHPRFSSVQVLDRSGGKKPRWVRTNVVVDDHLVVPNLDPKATSNTPDQLVEDYLSSLSTATMDPSRPLWDLHILNIRTTGSEAVAVLRVHHSLGDGISLMALLLACTRKTSDPDSLPTLPEARGPVTGKNRSLWTILLWLWAMLVTVWHTLVDILLFGATAVFLKDTETPLKGKKGVEFHRKRFVHRTVSLDDVKAIKKVMGCVSSSLQVLNMLNSGATTVSLLILVVLQTINDVLVGLTSAGLSRYLSRSFGEGDGGKKGLPANVRIRASLLVNIRRTPRIHALAEMMKGESGGTRWGNCLGYMILKFPILACKDPLDYIHKGKAITERKKNSLEAFFTYKSACWIVKIFGIKAATTLCHRMVAHTTLSFSNVVGPVEEIGFYGHPLIYLAPSVYGHPQALTLHFQSYMNKLTMVAAVDESSIPDPHQLLDDLAESLKLIKDAAAESS